jgi:hypothetical protein
VVCLLVVAAIGVLVFLRTTDGTEPGTGTTFSPEAQPVPTATATAPPGVTAASVVGGWKGTYNCNQGLTTLRLTVIESAASGGLAATFSFSPDPSNPTVPYGSFLMRGSLTDGVLELKGERWIHRPGVYEMVGLSARVTEDRPTRLQGTVGGAGCSTFSLERS